MNKTVLENERMPQIIDNIESEVAELEVRVAPGLTRNHNETLVRDSEN